MKAALFRLPATGKPLENGQHRVGWRPGIIESAGEPLLRAHFQSLFWPCPWGWGRCGPPKSRAVALAVHDGLRPVEKALATEAVEQGVQELLPDAAPLPVPEPSPAGHTRAAAHLLG